MSAMATRPTAPIRRRFAVLVGAAMLLAACGSGDPKGGAGGRGGRGGAMGPTQVGYVVVQQGSAPMVQDLPGRVSAYQASDVRPQVSGVILRRLFREGSIVRQGQTLYQIDPSVYSAQAAQAAANLQSARASAEAARTLAARYRPLVAQQAISKQDYTNAVAQARQADAAIAQNAAALRAAEINLRFTRVPAPITGRIGLSAVTEGALVTANQTDALTTITRLDPVFVDIQESAADLLALRNALSQGGAVPTSAQVRLKLPDGSYYAYTGTVEFSQVLVDQNTGTVTLRARFANPQSILLPGMFVTAEFAQAIDTSAFLVPQQAVSRDPQGNATLFVVGPGNRAVQRTIVADRTQGPYWVVTQGLAPGEKVITQGTANLRDGAADQAGAAKRAAAGQGAAARRDEGRSWRQAGRLSPPMARIFIERPIFAWVLAIIISLGGIGAILSLPVGQYPDVAPTQINVRATYPGASAATLESSVTQVIEQTLTGPRRPALFQRVLELARAGLDHRRVRQERRSRHRPGPGPEQSPAGDRAAAAAGAAAGRDRDQGSPDFLMIVGVYDETDKSTNVDVSDWLATNIQDDLSRIPGRRRRQRLRLAICDAGVARPGQAVELPADAERRHHRHSEPECRRRGGRDRRNAAAARADARCDGDGPVAAADARAVPQHHREVGSVRRPRAPVGRRSGGAWRGQLFRDDPDQRPPRRGHRHLPRARRERSDDVEARQGENGAGRSRMPPGYAIAYANDSSDFIKLSVIEVVKTLAEAMALVILVMFVFLQSWRATLIPGIAIPVVLLGTFGMLYILGFSINTLTLFGLVLAVGLLVDDAIVVVENVERILHDHPELTTKEATIMSMNQIQMALVAIALVLSAVFLPMVFFGGSTGVIYRQFSATIVSAMGAVGAAGADLQPVARRERAEAKARERRRDLARQASAGASRIRSKRRGRSSTPASSGLIDWYVGNVGKVVDRKWLFLAIYAGVCVLLIFLFMRLPTGFIPSEDQGNASVQFRLPAGATFGRTQQVEQAVEHYFLKGPENEECAHLLCGDRRRRRPFRAEYGPGLRQPCAVR